MTTPPEDSKHFPIGTLIALVVVLSLWFLAVQAVPFRRTLSIDDRAVPPVTRLRLGPPDGWGDKFTITANGWPASMSVDVSGPGRRAFVSVSRHSFAGMALNLLCLALGIGAVVSGTCWGFYRPDQPRLAFRLRTLFLLMAFAATLLGGWKLAGRLSEDLVKAAIDDV